MQVYKFRDCLLNTIERSVIKEDKYLELTTKTFDVLQFLVENVGKVVTKDEILGNVWNGNFVEESNLPVHISKLRRALGEATGSRFIETVQGVGYRFVAGVESVNSRAWRESLCNAAPTLKSENGHELIVESIAVLPLVNETCNPGLEYLVDGLTECLINSLSLIQNLKVIARNSVFRYKDSELDAPDIGETLDVAAVLTGRIRIVEDELIIAAELVKVADGTQLWGKQFRRTCDEILSIPDEISSSVSTELQSKAIRANYPTDSVVTQSTESYKLFLKGRYFFNKRTVPEINKAIGCFRESILSDSTNLYSYSELIECYRLLYILDAISHEEAAALIRPLVLELSSLKCEIDVVHLAYAKLKFCLDWNFDEARRYCELALRLNANNIDAHFHYAEILVVLNRFADSLEHLNRILALDPLSLVTYKRIGRGLYRVASYEDAAHYLNVAIEMEPTDFESLALLGAVWVEMAEYERALAAFRRALQSQPSTEVMAMIGYTEAARGKKTAAQTVIRKLTSSPADIPKLAIKLARIHLALGEKADAYRYIEMAFRTHELDLTGLGYDPRWKAIRNEGKFQNLMRKVGLCP